MAERIAIDADLISSHAARVDQVAADASRATNMGSGAFGVLCAFLVPPATLAATMAGSAIAAAEGMLTRSAREVRGVATDMADFEDDVVRAVQSIEKALG